MKSLKIIASVLLGAALLTACSSTGNRQLKELTVQSAKQMIVEGKTTKDEVEAQFGSPDNVTFTEAGTEVWTYRYTETTSHAANFIPVANWFVQGADINTKEMIILFNHDNVVQRFTMRNSKNTTKAGILGK